MMEPDDACRIDEDVATELSRVAARVLRQSTARELLHIGDPRPPAPDVPEAPAVHTVAAVLRSILVDEHGPAELHFGQVRTDLRGSLERHDRDLYSQIPERLLLLLQLQQVPAAGESPKVPVKDQQEPMSPIVAEPVRASLCVQQLERNGGPAGLKSLSAVCHVFVCLQTAPNVLRWCARVNGSSIERSTLILALHHGFDVRF